MKWKILKKLENQKNVIKLEKYINIDKSFH